MLAIRGKKVDFEKVLKLIDDTVALLKQEQLDDEHKSGSCKNSWMMTKSHGEMDKIRAEEKAVFETASSDTENAPEGAKTALKVLNGYYSKADKAHSSADGASTGIIGLLEVCESDFSKSLTEMTATQESAVAVYETQTKEKRRTQSLRSPRSRTSSTRPRSPTVWTSRCQSSTLTSLVSRLSLLL